MTITIRLPMSHETRNTVVYQVDRDERKPIDTVYIRKSAFLAEGKAWPPHIDLTVEC